MDSFSVVICGYHRKSIDMPSEKNNMMESSGQSATHTHTHASAWQETSPNATVFSHTYMYMYST